MAVACIPGWKTNRISYVDIAWPWGLFLIGAMTMSLGEGWYMRNYAVSVIYMMIGGRMGMGGLGAWWRGRLDQEFPRYEYRHLYWK